MRNLIQIPKFIPSEGGNTNLSQYATPSLTPISYNDVETTPNSIGQTWITNFIKINGDGENENGVEFNFDYLEIGDFIEITCEIRSISGDKPVLKIGEFNTATREESVVSKRTVDLQGEWHTVNLKRAVTILKGWWNSRAFIGLEQGKSGLFEIRGVRAVAYTKTQAPKPEKKDYVIRIIKDTGNLKIHPSATDSGITLTHDIYDQLKIEYPRTTSAPILLVNSNYSQMCIIKTTSPSLTTVHLSFHDISGRKITDLDETLPNDIAISLYLTWR